MIRWLLLASLLLPSAALARQDWRKQDPAVMYEKGISFMKRGYYTRAMELFNAIRNYHRDDPVSIKAQLAIADMHFRKHEWEQARFAYEEFARYHPRHQNMDYVTYQIGMSIYRRASVYAGRDQTTTRGAVNVWTGFETRYPDSTYSEDVTDVRLKARNRLASKELYIARFYKKRGAWGAVARRCEDLVRRYPDTDSVPEALLLLGTASHAWGNVANANAARDRLIEMGAKDKWVRSLNKVLEGEPGEPPREEVFIRPYRVRAPTQPGG